MGANRFIAARHLQGGLYALLALVLVACAASPTEQLDRAEALLSRLESDGADQYLTYEMAEIRRGIEKAKKFMRGNRFEIAGEVLYQVCQKLDSCGVAFVKLRSDAEMRSHEKLQRLASELLALETAVSQLPRTTYVDQNRYDIQIHRLRRYHAELSDLGALIENQNFPEAIRRASNLEFQVEKTIAGVRATSRYTTRRVAQPAKETDQPKITGLMASSTR